MAGKDKYKLAAKGSVKPNIIEVEKNEDTVENMPDVSAVESGIIESGSENDVSDKKTIASNTKSFVEESIVNNEETNNMEKKSAETNFDQGVSIAHLFNVQKAEKRNANLPLKLPPTLKAKIFFLARKNQIKNANDFINELIEVGVAYRFENLPGLAKEFYESEEYKNALKFNK